MEAAAHQPEDTSTSTSDITCINGNMTSSASRSQPSSQSAEMSKDNIENPHHRTLQKREDMRLESSTWIDLFISRMHIRTRTDWMDDHLRTLGVENCRVEDRTPWNGNKISWKSFKVSVPAADVDRLMMHANWPPRAKLALYKPYIPDDIKNKSSSWGHETRSERKVDSSLSVDLFISRMHTRTSSALIEDHLRSLGVEKFEVDDRSWHGNNITWKSFKISVRPSDKDRVMTYANWPPGVKLDLFRPFNPNGGRKDFFDKTHEYSRSRFEVPGSEGHLAREPGRRFEVPGSDGHLSREPGRRCKIGPRTDSGTEASQPSKRPRRDKEHQSPNSERENDDDLPHGKGSSTRKGRHHIIASRSRSDSSSSNSSSDRNNTSRRSSRDFKHSGRFQSNRYIQRKPMRFRGNSSNITGNVRGYSRPTSWFPTRGRGYKGCLCSLSRGSSRDPVRSWAGNTSWGQRSSSSWGQGNRHENRTPSSYDHSDSTRTKKRRTFVESAKVIGTGEDNKDYEKPSLCSLAKSKNVYSPDSKQSLASKLPRHFFESDSSEGRCSTVRKRQLRVEIHAVCRPGQDTTKPKGYYSC